MTFDDFPWEDEPPVTITIEALSYVMKHDDEKNLVEMDVECPDCTIHMTFEYK